MTNKSSLLLPQVHRHDFQLHFDHIGLHQLVQRQLLAHLRWSRHRCHHLVWCVMSCCIFYIFLVCISCGIFMVQCCTLLNIFGASYLLYIFGALYLVLGLFFDANITFFGIVCFVKCALCCILLLVQCTHILMWPRSCLERWLPCCLYLSWVIWTVRGDFTDIKTKEPWTVRVTVFQGWEYANSDRIHVFRSVHQPEKSANGLHSKVEMTYCMMGRKSDNLRGTDKTSQRDYVIPVSDNQADGAGGPLLRSLFIIKPARWER